MRNGELPPGLAATLPNLPFEGAPLALVCIGSSCQPPVNTPGELQETLAKNVGQGLVPTLACAGQWLQAPQEV